MRRLEVTASSSSSGALSQTSVIGLLVPVSWDFQLQKKVGIVPTIGQVRKILNMYMESDLYKSTLVYQVLSRLVCGKVYRSFLMVNVMFFWLRQTQSSEQEHPCYTSLYWIAIRIDNRHPEMPYLTGPSITSVTKRPV